MGKERTTVNPDRQRQRFTRELKLKVVRLLELKLRALDMALARRCPPRG
jgi:hypothetical protein